MRYEVHPVTSYDEIRAKLEPMQIRAALLINLGATIDLEPILGDKVAFVLDANRPIHLRNLKSQAVVILDDSEADAVRPIDMGIEDEWGVVLSDDEEEEEEEQEEDLVDPDDGFLDGGDDVDDNGNLDGFIDDDGDENENSQPGRARKRVRRSKPDEIDLNNDPSVDAPEEGEEGDDDDDEIRPLRRKRRPSPPPSNTSLRPRHRVSAPPQALSTEKQLIRTYYASTHLATPSALIMHYITEKKRLSTPTVMWMAVLGATSQLLYHDDPTNYTRAASDIRQLLTEVTDDNRVTSYSADTPSPHVIIPAKELRLRYLRDWNVHDSLIHSCYTSTTLSTWRRNGRQRALELLATLGIRLRNAQQPFWAMPSADKQALDNHLHTVMRRFRLGEELEYDGFLRGGRGAGDWIGAICGLLSGQDSFWQAYDALGDFGNDTLTKGIDRAIELEQTVHRLGGEIIELRKYHSGGKYRYCFVEESNPVVLRMIAVFVRRGLKGAGVRDKGIVILGKGDGWMIVENGVGGGVRAAVRRCGGGVGVGWAKIGGGGEIEFLRVLTDVLR